MSESHGNGADTGVISLADRMYPGGPIEGPGDGRQRELIESGVAKPAASLLADQRSSPRGPEQRAEPAFDPAKLQGYEGVDPAITQDLGRIGISQRQATELRPIYERAVKDDMQRFARQLNEGSEQLSRELNPEDLATAKALIADPQMTPAALRPWLEEWGSHPDLVRMLVRWARAIRNGRY
jgi:hypothetical protein